MKWTPMLFMGDMIRALLERRKTQTRRPVMVTAGKGLRDVPLHVNYPHAEQMPREDWGAIQRHLGRPIATDRMYPFYPGSADRGSFALTCPWGGAGDGIYARETIWVDRRDDGVVIYSATPEFGKYRIDDRYVRASFPDTPRSGQLPTREEMGREMKTNANWIQRPSIHMPRWASRISLELSVAPRIERLQDITEHDAINEGCGNKTPCWKHAHDADHFCRDARDEYRGIWDAAYAKPIGPWDVNPWVWVLTFHVRIQEAKVA